MGKLIVISGPSGVGKTMMVKEYSKYLNIPLIKLDMSEYKESHTISKIIDKVSNSIISISN